MTTRTEAATSGGARARETTVPRPPSRTRWAPYAAALWSTSYLVLGLLWYGGDGAYPWDSAQDARGLNILDGVEQGLVAWLVIGLAVAGLAVTATLMALARRPGRGLGLLRVIAVGAALIGSVLAMVVPDLRILASVGYLPILLAMTFFVFDAGALRSDYIAWPTVNLLILNLAGAAFLTVAVSQWRLATCACQGCGRTGRAVRWTAPGSASRWGRWATAVAVAIPVDYATTRIVWALGIPFGVSQDLLDELGNQRYAGAALGLLGLGGALLTVGLVRPWGETWPRWVPRLRGRPVPVGVAVVPASIVAFIVMSAGLMFVRLRVTGELASAFPGGTSDLAAWVPEMFWPLWSLSLAAATYAYWLRRRVRCMTCGQGANP